MEKLMSKPKRPDALKVAFGFVYTPEKERMYRQAIRSAILFMQTFGKGRKPRLHGEYYTPGYNPCEREDSEKYLPLEAAARYCGCSAVTLQRAAGKGLVIRRAYLTKGKKTYYEYSIQSLDAFIEERGLM